MQKYGLQSLEQATRKRLLFINESIRKERSKNATKIQIDFLKQKRKEVDQLLSAITIAITKDDYLKEFELKQRYINTSL